MMKAFKNYNYCFHFPDGTETHAIDLSYCKESMRIGEALVIEGERPHYRIKDIQHQYRKETVEGVVWHKLIMVNVILEAGKDETQ